MVVVKCLLGADLRRFSVPDDIKFSDFLDFLYNLFGLPAGEFDSYSIKYKDDEGDVLSITTDRELAEAISLTQNQQPPILRIFIAQFASFSPVPARRVTTVYFQGRPLVPSASPEEEPNHDPAFDPEKKEALPSGLPATPSSKITISFEGTTTQVKAVEIEKAVLLPTPPPRFSGVSASASMTAQVVKEFSDAVIAATKPHHEETLNNTSSFSSVGSQITQEASDSILAQVNSTSDGAKVEIPVALLEVMSELATQTLELANSTARTSCQALEPLAKETIALQHESTMALSVKLNEDITSLVKLLMDTVV